jgi:NAD dependent epimerase/dehydratase
MNLKNKKALVTGAGGFIGSHLIEHLTSLGLSARAFVRYNSAGSWGLLDASPVKDDIEVFSGDIRDKESLKRAVKGVDVIFHFAALIAIPYSYHSPISYVRTNVEGTLNVLQSALENDVGLVVHTSTSEVYGTARYVPIDESHPLQGQSPYSASKIGADKIVEAFHLSYGLPVVTIRPFNTYGPRQSARAVIPTIITQALTQSQVKLGSLHPTRDLNFVKDTIEAFVRASECPEAVGKVINVGSGKEISIEGLAKTILTLLNKDIPIKSDEQRIRPDDSEVERLCADSTKAKKILKWHPIYTLTQGLRETIEWIEQNLDHYQPSVYTL